MEHLHWVHLYAKPDDQSGICRKTKKEISVPCSNDDKLVMKTLVLVA